MTRALNNQAFVAHNTITQNRGVGIWIGKTQE